MSREPEVQGDVRKIPFEITAEHGILRGDVRSSGGIATGQPGLARSEAAIVICHGFKGFKDWGFFPYLSERMAAETGAAVVSFNFSGCGVGPDLENFTDLEGFGRNTFTREQDDLALVVDGLRAGRLGATRFTPAEEIGLIGHSRGAAAVILVGAARKEVRAVVTWAGIGSVFRYEEQFEQAFRDSDVMEVVNARTGQCLPLYRTVLDDLRANREILDVEEGARRLGSRLLIVHGSADEAVPVEEGRALHEAAAGSELLIIGGAGHTMNASHPFPGTNPKLEEAVARSADHFRRHLEARP